MMPTPVNLSTGAAVAVDDNNFHYNHVYTTPVISNGCVMGSVYGNGKKAILDNNMMATPVNLSGGGGAPIAVDSNNYYYNHVNSHHSVMGSGSGSGSGINGVYGNGVGSMNGKGFVKNKGDKNTLLPQTHSALHYGSNLSVVWTPQEDAILKELLAKFAPKGIFTYDSRRFIDCYARIAKELNKSIRDIAFRCKWMRDKDYGKQRKDDQIPRKSKERKEKVTDSAPRSQVPNRTSCPPPPFGESFRPMDGNDGIPDEAVFGPLRQLTAQSDEAMRQVSENINSLKLRDNIHLLSKVRSNAIAVLQELYKCDTDVTENTKPMPPIPAKINEELFSTVVSQAQLFAN